MRSAELERSSCFTGMPFIDGQFVQLDARNSAMKHNTHEERKQSNVMNTIKSESQRQQMMENVSNRKK